MKLKILTLGHLLLHAAVAVFKVLLSRTKREGHGKTLVARVVSYFSVK